MPNEELPTKKYSETDLIEERSKFMLRSKLPLSEALISYFGEKYPTWDGLIEFFNDEGSTATKMFFQLKGTEKDIRFYDVETSFLNYCYKAPEPHFLILVNIPGNKVYWEHIDKEYIENVLNIRDLKNFSQGSKRIQFLESKVIEQNASILIETCKKHYVDNAKQFVPTAEAPIVIPNKIESAPFGEVKKKFSPATEGLEDKIILYHSFIYALRPFYLDQRGEDKRKKLLSYLGITDTEERFIIEKLTQRRLINRTGDLISTSDKQDAISSMSYFVEIGRIDLEEITKLFSDDQVK